MFYLPLQGDEDDDDYDEYVVPDLDFQAYILSDLDLVLSLLSHCVES